jgi:hypothetical protein
LKCLEGSFCSFLIQHILTQNGGAIHGSYKRQGSQRYRGLCRQDNLSLQMCAIYAAMSDSVYASTMNPMQHVVSKP